MADFNKKNWYNVGDTEATDSNSIASKTTMNDLENRIEQAINNLKTAISTSESKLQNSIKTLETTTKENIDKEKYYKAGDTVNIAGYYTGIITSSGTNIFFTIFLPKLVSKTSGITLNCKNLCIRHADGGYIADDNGVFNELVSSYSTVNYLENRINILLILKSSTKFTNNSLVSVNLRDPATITFK